MPPLNALKEQVKPQPLEMDEEYLKENLSQQKLVQNPSRTSSDTFVAGTENAITRQKIITVIVLCYVNLINYMDRYTIAGKPKVTKSNYSVVYNFFPTLNINQP